MPSNNGLLTLITFHRSHLSIAFRDVHPDACSGIAFQRTLRVPDDGREYPLPPGFGEFPIKPAVGSRTPGAWQHANAVLLPMWPSEAMWLDTRWGSYPCAIKVATGGINALTGEPCCPRLAEPQDYIVAPQQPWLDGYVVDTGVVRQFVAMPLGIGRSVAEQLAASPSPISLSLSFFPMTRASHEYHLANMQRATGMSKPLALAAGGKIRQDVYRDTYGIEAWVAESAANIDVYLVPARAWRKLTGNRPPVRSPKAEDYTAAGLPWFDYYDPLAEALEATDTLAGIDRASAPGDPSRGFSVPDSQIARLGKKLPPST
jgi:hypothetical protein